MMKKKWITYEIFLVDEEGKPDNSYLKTISDEEPPNPEDYLYTNFNGTRSSIFGTHRIRFLDGHTGENLNAQEYYERGTTGCTSQLVFQELKSPLFRQMVQSLRNVFADEKTQVITIGIVGVVAAVAMYLIFG